MKLSFECDMGWDDLVGDSSLRRHCQQCDTDVHNLAAMTRAEARALVDAHRGVPCIRIRTRGGRVLHTDDPEARLLDQREGLRRLVLAAAAVAPFLVAGCAPELQSHAVPPAGDTAVVGAASPGAASKQPAKQLSPAEELADDAVALVAKLQREMKVAWLDLFRDDECEKFTSGVPAEIQSDVQF